MKTTEAKLRLKHHLRTHKVKYAVGTTLAVALYAHTRTVAGFYKFLETKEIDPMEFYWPELFEELNP